MLVAHPLQERRALGEIVRVDRRRLPRELVDDAVEPREHLEPVGGRDADVAQHAFEIVVRATRATSDRSPGRSRRRETTRASRPIRHRRSRDGCRASGRWHRVRTRTIGCTTRWSPRSWRSSSIVTESTRNGMSSFTIWTTVWRASQPSSRASGRTRGRLRRRRGAAARDPSASGPRPGATPSERRLEILERDLCEVAPDERVEVSRRSPSAGSSFSWLLVEARSAPVSPESGTLRTLPLPVRFHRGSRATPRARDRTGRSRRRDHDAEVSGERSRSHDEAGPHAGERSRPGGRAARCEHRIAEATHHSVVGEEFDDLVGDDGETRWIIDPIDGTKNYVRGVPIWATLIGLEHAGELVVGVVSAPALHMRWWAGAGLGAFRERRARSTCRRSRRSTTRSSRSRGTRSDRSTRRHRSAVARARRTGAGGRAASATSGSTCSSPRARSTPRSIRSSSLWDVAALVPIVEEAGGRWSTVDGRADADGASFVVHERRACTTTSLAARSKPVASAARCPEITVGIDIGTSSVKAVAADADGDVVARARIPHEFHVPSPLRFEHDAAEAWYDGPRRALEALGDIRPRGVSVAAMVPSLTAVDEDGCSAARRACLYGDERGHSGERGGIAEVGELAQFLRWHAEQRPDARGYWMAQAGREPRAHRRSGHLDDGRAAAAVATRRLRRGGTTDLVEAAGARVEQMPRDRGLGHAARRGPRLRRVCARGGHDRRDGRADRRRRRRGRRRARDPRHDPDRVGGDARSGRGFRVLLRAAHRARGKWLLGGPSNAGGLFLEWVDRLAGASGAAPSPHDVPVWVPYPRANACRSMIRAPARAARRPEPHTRRRGDAARGVRGVGFRDPAHHRRVADTRAPHRRVGGGTRVAGWVEALADTTGLPVHVARSSRRWRAWAPRSSRAWRPVSRRAPHDAPRWARFERIVDPDPAWIEAPTPAMRGSSRSPGSAWPRVPSTVRFDGRNVARRSVKLAGSARIAVLALGACGGDDDEPTRSTTRSRKRSRTGTSTASPRTRQRRRRSGRPPRPVRARHDG